MGADLGAAKAAARKAALARRKAAHSAAAGAAACARLLGLLQNPHGKVVAGYMPIRTEADIRPAMLELAGANTLCVPVIRAAGLPLAFHRWTPEAEMMPGPFGALVPRETSEVKPQIVILPLVAFDSRGMRLGYGGGFYDRSLSQLRAAGPVWAIGFAYASQEAAELPVETTDQRMDAVVTEREVLRFSVPGAPADAP